MTGNTLQISYDGCTTLLPQHVGVLCVMTTKMMLKFHCIITAEVTKPKAEPSKLPELNGPAVKPPKPQVRAPALLSHRLQSVLTRHSC